MDIQRHIFIKHENDNVMENFKIDINKSISDELIRVIKENNISLKEEDTILIKNLTIL